MPLRLPVYVVEHHAAAQDTELFCTHSLTLCYAVMGFSQVPCHVKGHLHRMGWRLTQADIGLLAVQHHSRLLFMA